MKRQNWGRVSCNFCGKLLKDKTRLFFSYCDVKCKRNFGSPLINKDAPESTTYPARYNRAYRLQKKLARILQWESDRLALEDDDDYF